VHRGSQTGVGGRKFADLGHVEGGVRGILAVSFQPSATFAVVVLRASCRLCLFFCFNGSDRREKAACRDKKLKADS
jgi:hypothetical protein